MQMGQSQSDEHSEVPPRAQGHFGNCLESARLTGSFNSYQKLSTIGVLPIDLVKPPLQRENTLNLYNRGAHAIEIPSCTFRAERSSDLALQGLGPTSPVLRSAHDRDVPHRDVRPGCQYAHQVQQSSSWSSPPFEQLLVFHR